MWSIGARVGAGRSTRVNEDLRWNISPGIEYNFVPYSESSRRAITVQALLNVRHWDYTEETIYFRTEETRAAASRSAVAASYAVLTGCLSGRFQIGKVSNLA